MNLSSSKKIPASSLQTKLLLWDSDEILNVTVGPFGKPAQYVQTKN